MMHATMNAPELRQRDFSSVGYDEALERARALIPFLRQHGAANDSATKLVPEVLNALHENGLFRYIQPKVWGGMELDFVAYFDVPEMLGRGDASAAWVVANLGSHHRGLAQWPQQAQEEIWGDNPDMLIASGIAFLQGSARRVDDACELLPAGMVDARRKTPFSGEFNATVCSACAALQEGDARGDQHVRVVAPDFFLRLLRPLGQATMM